MVVIPCQVDEKYLEAKVLSIFQKFDCTITSEFINDCHRLGKNNGQVIVEFTRRKVFKQVLQVKKDMKDLPENDGDLPWEQKYL